LINIESNEKRELLSLNYRGEEFYKNNSRRGLLLEGAEKGN